MDKELIAFIDDAHAKLDGMELRLMGMAQDSTPDEARTSHFRTAYGSKDQSLDNEIATAERFTNVLECLLEQLRNGLIDHTPELTGLILAGCDHVRALLDHMTLQQGGDLPALELESTDYGLFGGTQHG